MAKHLCCIHLLLTLPAVAALTTPPLRRSRGRAPVAQSTRTDNHASRRHVTILRASDDDEAEPFFDAPPPGPATNDDRIVAYVAVGSTLVFFGLYAYETLRLMAEGEFYMPHF